MLLSDLVELHISPPKAPYFDDILYAYIWLGLVRVRAIVRTRNRKKSFEIKDKSTRAIIS